MRNLKTFAYLIILIAGSSCSSVKVAVFDQQKRKEYAFETKEAFAKSPAGKELALKQSILNTARQYIGTKYKYGSYDPKKGFDCSGLVYHSAKKNNIELPRSSSTLAAAAPHISWKNAKPGDLVFFGDRGRIDHVALVEKNNPPELWIIHSTTQRGVILEEVMASAYWKKRLLFAVDFGDLQTEVAHQKSSP